MTLREQVSAQCRFLFDQYGGAFETAATTADDCVEIVHLHGFDLRFAQDRADCFLDVRPAGAVSWIAFYDLLDRMAAAGVDLPPRKPTNTLRGVKPVLRDNLPVLCDFLAGRGHQP